MLSDKCFAGAAAIMLLCGLPHFALAQSVQPLPTDEAEFARFREAVEAMRAQMFRPGERVEGWDRGGADPDGDLRRMGADRHYFLTRDSSSRQVSIFTDRPLRDFIPSGWQVVDSYGRSGEPLRNPSLEFHRLSPRYVLAARGTTTRRNDADCSNPVSHALLLEVPGAPASPDDEMVPALFRMSLLAAEGVTYCVRSEGSASTGYRVRYFLPDGRRLPVLDEVESVISIVPAAPIEQLLSGEDS